MRVCRSGGALVVGLLMMVGLWAPSKAHAGKTRVAAWHSPGGSGHHAPAVTHARTLGAARHVTWRHPLGHAWRGYARLQCVPFARDDSGIELKGNANIWWNEAAGRYERGSRPEPGSVLSFAANGRMRLGHVAVVSNVVNAREIEIDHANWSGPRSYGGVARGVPVIDVSPDNDWTEVRVSLGDGAFGSVYRTHGFIYDRPDSGTMLANAAPARTTGFQTISTPIATNDEVAEVPDEADFRTSRAAGWNLRHRGLVRPSWRQSWHKRPGQSQTWHSHAQAGHPLAWHPRSLSANSVHHHRQG